MLNPSVSGGSGVRQRRGRPGRRFHGGLVASRSSASQAQPSAGRTGAVSGDQAHQVTATSPSVGAQVHIAAEAVKRAGIQACRASQARAPMCRYVLVIGWYRARSDSSCCSTRLRWLLTMQKRLARRESPGSLDHHEDACLLPGDMLETWTSFQLNLQRRQQPGDLHTVWTYARRPPPQDEHEAEHAEPCDQDDSFVTAPAESIRTASDEPHNHGPGHTDDHRGHNRAATTEVTKLRGGVRNDLFHGPSIAPLMRSEPA